MLARRNPTRVAAIAPPASPPSSRMESHVAARLTCLSCWWLRCSDGWREGGRRGGGVSGLLRSLCRLLASLILRLTLALLVGPSALFSSMCHRIGRNTQRRTAIGGRRMNANSRLESILGIRGGHRLKKFPTLKKSKLKRVALGTSSDFFLLLSYLTHPFTNTHLHSTRESVNTN